MTYPGGKNAVYQHIINQIPPHEAYIEPFAGSAAVYRRLRRARHSYLVEADPDQAQALNTLVYNGDTSTTVHNCDAVPFLRQLSPRVPTRTFIYADPPYLFSTRASQRPLYNCEFGTEEQHKELLAVLLHLSTLGVKIALSGYHSDLYATMLANWRTITFTATTRGGTVATEYLWMNYPQPERLHDYRYLGKDYRERERIKRKGKRWVDGLARLPVLERRAILAQIEQRYF